MFAHHKLIGRLLYVPGAIIGAAAAAYRYRVDYEAVHAPLQPFVGTGNIVPWARHGALHYITAEQAHALSLSWQVVVVSLVAMAVGVLIEWGPKARRRT